MRPALAGALAVVAAVAVAAPAGAQAPPPAPPGPQPAALALLAEDAAGPRARPLALSGTPLRVRGGLSPAVAGEAVVVRFYRNGRKLAARAAAVDSTGRFRVSYVPRRSGTLVVRASHAASAQLGAVQARLVVRVVKPRVGPGASRALLRAFQARLDALGYAVPRSGAWDGGTQRAVMAYRKVNGMPRSYSASRAIVQRVLRGRGGYKVRHPTAGRHVEADLSRQIVVLVDGRRVASIYHASSGAPATPTVLGSFRVYRKTPGVNAKGMVHSVYFIRGYAIHGYASVPPYNASHGCLRVPIPNARSIFDWLRFGDRVIVDR